MAQTKTILIAIIILLTSFISPALAQENTCITHKILIEEIYTNATNQTDETPEFRIAKTEDGQSLVYWHLGGENNSFNAVTFKTNGCAVLNPSGEIRKFIFPKTAFNTGVFFELDILETNF